MMMPRETAKKLFEELPMPGTEELWRKTNFKKVPLEQFAPLPLAADVTSTKIPLLPAVIPTVGELLYGEHNSTPRLDKNLAQQGVQLLTLSAAMETCPALLQKYLGRGFQNRREKFLAQNDAFWSAGAVLYIPKNVTITEPILIIQQWNVSGKTGATKLLVVCDQGGMATVIHYAVSQLATGGNNFLNNVTEIFVEADAKLQFIDLQNYSEQSYEVAHKRAEISANATLTWTIDLQGSAISKNNIETILTGEGAHAEVFGLVCAARKQHLEFCSHTQHNTPRTSANLLIKSTADNEAVTIFQGMIKIAKGAQQTDSYMANNNLVLSDKAHTDSIPRLEIEADDVKASHGATIGQVDPEQMFYLKSRGLNAMTAERLLIDGFCEDIFNRVSLEPIRELMRQNLLTKQARG